MGRLKSPVLTTEALWPLVVELDFQRGSQTIYKSINFIGWYVQVLIGMKAAVIHAVVGRAFQHGRRVRRHHHYKTLTTWKLPDCLYMCVIGDVSTRQFEAWVRYCLDYSYKPR